MAIVYQEQNVPAVTTGYLQTARTFADKKLTRSHSKRVRIGKNGYHIGLNLLELVNLTRKGIKRRISL